MHGGDRTWGFRVFPQVSRAQLGAAAPVQVGSLRRSRQAVPAASTLRMQMVEPRECRRFSPSLARRRPRREYPRYANA